MIRPIDEYTGKVDPVSSQYPDGKARNISAPGDGTGTPLDAKWLNDVFGIMQYLTAKAGITPSGTPENAETSQVFESMWQLLNARALTFNLTADANYTLTADQNLYKNITITDTGVVLTAGRNIIVDDIGRIFLFTNSTAQTLTVKTAAGTGVAVAAGASAALVCDETDVLDFADFSSAGREVATAAEIRTGADNEKVITPLGINDTIFAMGQTRQDVTASRNAAVNYQNTTGKPIEVNITVVANAEEFAYLYCDSSSVPTTKVAEYRNVDNLNEFTQFNITVLPNEYYRFDADAGDSNIETWVEIR